MRQLSFWDETVHPLSPEVNGKQSSPDTINTECKTDSGKASLQCRKSAAALQKQIDAKHHSANSLLLQFPTRKRLTDAVSLRRAAIRLEQVQATLERLADMHDEGRIPSELAHLNSRGAVESALFTSPTDSTIRTLYNSAGRDERKDERILRMTQEALMQNIPGYFPTPEPLAQRLVELANIHVTLTISLPFGILMVYSGVAIGNCHLKHKWAVTAAFMLLTVVDMRRFERWPRTGHYADKWMAAGCFFHHHSCAEGTLEFVVPHMTVQKL